MITDTRPVQDFLAQDVYLPKYVNFMEEDYNAKTGIFIFNIQEPPVDRGKIVNYATPRGYHICIAQAEYALVEHLLKEGNLPELGELDVGKLRAILLTGRVKIGRLDEHFRKEVPLNKPIYAKVNLRRSRKIGANPKLEFHFDFANRSMWGMSLSSIATEQVSSLNAEVSRF